MWSPTTTWQFHDGIDIETYGNPGGSYADRPAGPPYSAAEEYWDRRPVAIDFYNNLMTNFHDNPFEIDGSMHNVRVMRNLMINSASHAFCNQPALGGPVYWIRNIAYNLPVGPRGELPARRRPVPTTTRCVRDAAPTRNMHWRTISSWGRTRPRRFSRDNDTNYTRRTTTASARILPRKFFSMEFAAVGHGAGLSPISSRPWTPENW